MIGPKHPLRPFIRPRPVLWAASALLLVGTLVFDFNDTLTFLLVWPVAFCCALTEALVKNKRKGTP